MLVNDRAWKEFKIIDLFNCKRGNQNNMNQLEHGQVMLISAKNTNNGVKGFFKSTPSKGTYPGDCITLNNDGDGGVGLAYYQPCAFLLDSHVYALYPKVHMSKFASLFIARSISQQRICFSHGRSISTKRLKHMKILLPINQYGKPDYSFMELFTKEIIQRKKQAYVDYAKKAISSFDYEEIVPLENKVWSAFPVGCLFSSIVAGKGKGLNHLVKAEGRSGINYVGATNRNNGVLCQVEINNGSKEMIQPGNCIGFIRNGEGSVGYAIYKEEEFISTSDVSFAYDETLNRYIALFIVASSNLIRGKYNHNYKRTPQRLKKDSIMLPVNTQGQPDYVYMEQYIKNIMHQKYKDYLEHINKQG